MLLLTPRNIEYYATSLHTGADTQGRAIHFFSSGSLSLLEVPIGEIDPQGTVVITVGLNSTHPNTAGVDADHIVGISDGTNKNIFEMREEINVPCRPRGGSHDNPSVAAGTPFSSSYKLTFTPFNKFGFCESAQVGGYINTATFSAQIDITKPLFLIVERERTGEEFYYHYFLVEIYGGM